MKTKILSILTLFILIFSFACQKKELVKINPDNIVKPEISLTSSNIILEEANVDDEITFNWSSADYGVSVAVQYTLEMDRKNNDFEDALILGTTSESSVTLTKGELNSTVISFGLIEYIENDIELRVKSVISDHYDIIYSDTKSLKLTPYYTEIDYPVLYVPGDYQGWAPSNEETVIYSVNMDDIYEGYMYFDDAYQYGFKFTSQPNWDNDENIYGDEDASGTTGILANPGNNILGADSEAGYYKLNADIGEMTYSVLKTEWSLYGSATGTGDMAMIVDDTDNPKSLLTVTGDLSVGEFVFRANASNDLFYGDTNANFKLAENDGTIEISQAGNYTVTLNLSEAIYTYTVTQN